MIVLLFLRLFGFVAIKNLDIVFNKKVITLDLILVIKMY